MVRVRLPDLPGVNTRSQSLVRAKVSGAEAGIRLNWLERFRKTWACESFDHLPKSP